MVEVNFETYLNEHLAFLKSDCFLVLCFYFLIPTLYHWCARILEQLTLSAGQAQKALFA